MSSADFNRGFNRNMQVSDTTILASGSQTRLLMLQRAGVPVQAVVARIDEEAIRRSLEAEQVQPAEMSMVLAEMKARKVSQAHPERMVIGCDQILEFEGRALGKARSLTEAREHLAAFRGRTHELHSAVAVYRTSRSAWRHTATARLRARNFSDAYLEQYVARHGEQLLDTVGCYRIEEEGIRLFSSVDGDFFAICGFPLISPLPYLGDAGALAG